MLAWWLLNTLSHLPSSIIDFRNCILYPDVCVPRVSLCYGSSIYFPTDGSKEQVCLMLAKSYEFSFCDLSYLYLAPEVFSILRLLRIFLSFLLEWQCRSILCSLVWTWGKVHLSIAIPSCPNGTFVKQTLLSPFSWPTGLANVINYVFVDWFLASILLCLLFWS